MAVKLGNGNWAVKEDKLLAYNDNSGLFFNKEFDFSRGTSATYVAKDGLIKTAGIQPNIVNNGDFSELGSELVTNGDFSQSGTPSSTSYTLGWYSPDDGVSISNGELSLTKQSTLCRAYATDGISSISVLTSGKTYKLVYTVTEKDEGAALRYYNGTYINIDGSVGTHTVYYKATTQYFILLNGSDNKTIKLDNVSVKQVDPNDYWETEGNSSITVGTYEGRSNVANINILNTSTSSRIRQPFNYVNGKKYKVTVNVFLVSGSFRVDCRDSFVSGDFVSTSTTGSWLTLSAEIDAISTGTDNVWLRSLSAVSQFYVDNISVQEIQTDTPRIDFTNDTKGHLLLEPSRTNLVNYSEDFSQWTAGSNTSVTFESDIVAPDGSLGVYRLRLPAQSSTYLAANVFASQNPLALSIYAKSVNTNNDFHFYDGNNPSPTKTANDEWQRFNYIGNGDEFVIVNFADTFETDIYIWGAQAEAGSYATSYIPTTGAASTRNADVCNNSGSAQDFNSEEGVLYAELSALANGGVNRYISLSDNTSSNRLQIIYSGTSNRLTISGVGNVGGVFTTINHTPFVQNQFNKIAIKYSSSGCKVFVNGSEVGSNTDNTSWVKNALTTFDLTLWNQSTAPFIGKVRNVQVFTEALTDEQLEKLTS